MLQVVSATTRRAAWRDSAARARRRRSRHACRPARARRPHSRRRDRLQGPAAGAGGSCLHRAREPARAGPHRDGRRPHRGARALARAAARRAARRRADARLSRRAGPHRLCGRARRTGERDRAPRRSRRRRLCRATTRRQTPRDLLDALAAGADDRRSRSSNTSACWRACRRAAVARLREAWGEPGRRSRCARRRLPFPRAKIRQCSWSRCRPIAAAPRSGAPTITIRRCRRGTRWSPSGFGCNTWRRSTRSSIWARMARWNGCRARRSRSPRNAFRKSSPGRCR